jgi:hypothetical protein
MPLSFKLPTVAHFAGATLYEGGTVVRMLGVARRISPSMVVACIALVISLGGVSYAAVKLPKGSVGSRELKKNAVTRVAVKNSAINGSKVATDSLTGSDIKEATLGAVALAAASTHANAAAALDKVTYRSVGGSVGPSTPDPADPANFLTTLSAATSAGCDPGQTAVGGGAHVDDPSSLAIHESYPSTARTWTAIAGNDDETAAHTFTVYVICVPAAAVG